MTIGGFSRRSSLDLGFLELDVLARARVVFAEGHLLGGVARILLGHVEEAGVGGAVELDLDRGRLGHDSLSNSGFVQKIKAAPPPLICAPPSAAKRRRCQGRAALTKR